MTRPVTVPLVVWATAACADIRTIARPSDFRRKRIDLLLKRWEISFSHVGTSANSRTRRRNTAVSCYAGYGFEFRSVSGSALENDAAVGTNETIRLVGGNS